MQRAKDEVPCAAMRRVAGLGAVLLLAGIAFPLLGDSDWKDVLRSDASLESLGLSDVLGRSAAVTWARVAFFGIVGALALLACASARVLRAFMPWLGLLALVAVVAGWPHVVGDVSMRPELPQNLCAVLLGLLAFGAWSHADHHLGSPDASRRLGRALVPCLLLLGALTISLRPSLTDFVEASREAMANVKREAAEFLGRSEGPATPSPRGTWVMPVLVGLVLFAGVVRALGPARWRGPRVLYTASLVVLMGAAVWFWFVPVDLRTFAPEQARDQALALLPAYGRFLGLSLLGWAGLTHVFLQGYGRRA